MSNRFFISIFKASISLLLVLGTVVSYAQPGDPGGDPDVPISGIGLLIAAGVLYGMKKIHNTGKRK